MPPVRNNSTKPPTPYHYEVQTAKGPRFLDITSFSEHMDITFPIRPVPTPLLQYPPLPGQQPQPTAVSARVPSYLEHVVSVQEQIPPSNQVLPDYQTPLSQQQQNFPPAQGPQAGPASVQPTTRTAQEYHKRYPKLSPTPKRIINPANVNWGPFSYYCPYINPITGVRCPVASMHPIQWQITRHASTHVFAEIRAMKEGILGFCQGTIVSSVERFERYRECWFFCDKCLLIKSRTARTAGIKFSMQPGTFMCDSCEEAYFTALRDQYRPR